MTLINQLADPPTLVFSGKKGKPPKQARVSLPWSLPCCHKALQVSFLRNKTGRAKANLIRNSPLGRIKPVIVRRGSSGGMEWLGVWNCIFSGSEFSNFGAWNLAKIALSAEFQGFSWKFRPLENIFRTLENGHSIRHQSIPPLSAGRVVELHKPANPAAKGVVILIPVCKNETIKGKRSFSCQFGAPTAWIGKLSLETILTTPTRQYLQNICPQNMPCKGAVWHKSSLQSRDFYRMAYGPKNVAYEPPLLMPYEPFFLGVVVVFNLLNYLWRDGVVKSGPTSSSPKDCRNTPHPFIS